MGLLIGFGMDTQADGERNIVTNANAVAFGDSVTGGAGVSFEESFIGRLSARIGVIDNRWISGSLVSEQVARIAQYSWANTVIWLTGYTDMRAGTDIKSYTTSLRAGVAMCHRWAQRVVIGTCLRMTPVGYAIPPRSYGSNARVEQFNAAIQTVAAEFPGTLVAEIGLDYDPDNNYDLIHPNADGHRQIYNAFWRVIADASWRNIIYLPFVHR